MYFPTFFYPWHLETVKNGEVYCHGWWIWLCLLPGEGANRWKGHPKWVGLVKECVPPPMFGSDLKSWCLEVTQK